MPALSARSSQVSATPSALPAGRQPAEGDDHHRHDDDHDDDGGDEDGDAGDDDGGDDDAPLPPTSLS